MTGILVAEQDDELRVRLLEAFDEQWWPTYAVPDAHAALRVLHEARPHVLVADAELPGLCGIGLCRAVRALSAVRDMTVILLSAQGMSDRLRRNARVCAVMTPDPEATPLLARLRTSPIGAPHGTHANGCPAVASGEPGRWGDACESVEPAATAGVTVPSLPLHRIAPWVTS